MAYPLRDDRPPRRVMWATWSLLIACMVVFGFLQPKPMQGVVHGLNVTDNSRALLQVQAFQDRYGLIPCEVTHGRSMHDGAACDGYPVDHPEYYPSKNVYLPLLIVLFLHGSLAHLLGNMLFLWVFGRGVEERLGWPATLALFVAGGIAASLGFVALHPEATEPLVGASGAIAALMGAYLVLQPRRRILSMIYSAGLQFVYLPAWAVLAFFFAEQFFIDPSEHVAWEAHVAGMAFGAIVALVAAWRWPTLKDAEATPSPGDAPHVVLPEVASWPSSPPLTPPW